MSTDGTSRSTQQGVEDPTHQPSPEPPPASYRSAAASGSVWGVLQLVFAKGTATASTFAFVYLLTPESVGIAASALSFVSLLLIFPPPVISDVLVRHGHDLVHWIAPGRRLARFVAGVSAALILAAAAIVGFGLGQVELAVVVVALAFRALFESLTYPPLSRMRVGLRFRQIAVVDALVAATVMVVGIGYAWVTRRPEAMVVGFVAGAVVKLVGLSIGAGPRDDAPATEDRWPRLFREFRHACLGHYVFAILLVVDYLVLMLFCSKHVVGIYYTAFVLSTQINTALGVTLGIVVQPIFGHLRGDPERQVRAFAAVTRSIAALAIPAALLQAALSRILFELALPAKWAESAPLLEILSVAMCFACCMGPCLAMLTAQARFGAYLRLQLAQLGFLGTTVAAGALLGGDERGATYAAYAVVAEFVIFGPVALWLAARRPDLAPSARLGAGEAMGVFVRPFVLAAIATIPTAAAAHLDLGLATPARIGVVTAAVVASVVLYAILTRSVSPAVWRDLRTEFHRLAGRFLERRDAAATAGGN